MPNQLTVDTSFVVDALVPAQHRHRAASDYLAAMISAQPLVVFNRLLEIELLDTAFRLAIKERHGSSGLEDRLADGRVRRRAALNAGVGTIVTSDKGFARVPESEMTLIVPPSEVGKLRAVRGGRARR